MPKSLTWQKLSIAHVMHTKSLGSSVCTAHSLRCSHIEYEFRRLLPPSDGVLADVTRLVQFLQDLLFLGFSSGVVYMRVGECVCVTLYRVCAFVSVLLYAHPFFSSFS